MPEHTALQAGTHAGAAGQARSTRGNLALGSAGALRDANPASYAALIAANPAMANELIAELQRTFGNAFVQEVITASRAQGKDDKAGAIGFAGLAGTPAAAPDSATPAGQRDLALSTLTDAVQIAEIEVATLQTRVATLDRAIAADAIVAAAAQKVVSALSAVPFLVQLANGDGALVPALTPLLVRLDNAIAALQILGKRYKVRMREAHLERIFDLEDSLLQAAGKPTAKRAAAYYADDALDLNTQGPTPDAKRIKSELLDMEGAPKGKATDRDALLRDVQSLAITLNNSLAEGLRAAGQTLHEPIRAKHDGLESLAAFIGDMLLGNVKFIIGKLSKGRLKALAVPEEFVDSLTEGFKEAGKNVVKGALPSPTNKPPRGPQPANDGSHDKNDGQTEGLSPKSVYLNAAGKKTVEAMDLTMDRFNKKAALLERLPNDDLAAILDDVDIGGFVDAYKHLVVQEWVNFGKLASERGVDMRDPALKDGNPSRLDPALRPWGVLQIELQLDAQGGPSFRRAMIPSVGPSVAADLKHSGKTLGDLGVHRRIQIVGATNLDAGGGSFDVSSTGEIIAGPLSESSRSAFARLAGADVIPSDTSVRTGMLNVLGWLRGIGCDRISADG